MTQEIILVLSLAIIIGLDELKSRRSEKLAHEIRSLHRNHTMAMRAELMDSKKTFEAALLSVNTRMGDILSHSDKESKEARALISETKAKLEHMVKNFELKTRLADEHNQNFDTIEM